MFNPLWGCEENE